MIWNIGEYYLQDKQYKLQSKSSEVEAQEKKNQQQNRIVDPELADIVLVKRNEMIEWQQRQKQLKYDLALTKKKVEMKLKECKERFEK